MRKVILTLLLGLSPLGAQTTVNPDISAIGDLIFDNGSYSSSGLELAIQGYVNPLARADVYLHKHLGDAPIEFEEAFISIERGLPLGLGLRSGKFRPDLGKINKEHMHTFPMIVTPQSVATVLGEEMWGGVGLQGDGFLPLPWFSKLAVGYFQEGIAPHHHEHDGHQPTEPDTLVEEGSNPAWNGRLSHFFDLTEVTHLEFGTSYYLSPGGEPQNLWGVDFKFRWRPSRYRSLTWQGDYYHVTADEPEPLQAGYSWISYQFSQVWNTGVVADYVSDLDEAVYSALGLFIGFSPMEESSVFRFRLGHAWHGAEKELSLLGQIIWSLGPHKPHVF